MDITLGQAAAGVVAFATFLTAVFYLRRTVIKPIVNMLIDWNGSEARPGVARTPGVMERLGAIEDKVDTVTLKVAEHAILDSRVSALEVSALRADARHEELMMQIISFQNILLKEGGKNGPVEEF